VEAITSRKQGTVLLNKHSSQAYKIRKLHDKEFQNLYSSPYIIRMIRSRTIRWVRHVACTVEMRNAYKFVLESLKRRDHS
jgi:hypothetical protein